MAVYKKPWIEKYCGASSRRAEPQYPYSREMLRAYDAFELFPMDGGGFFFTQQQIGGTDTERFLKTLRSGKLLGPWRKRAKKFCGAKDLDWLARYDDSKPKGYLYQTVEQHVWLNRLYFLLPMAQQFLRTGDKRWAKQWFEYFESWNDTFPLPDEKSGDPGPGRAYVWRDMQVAWRLIVMIHSVAMFGGRGGAFTPSQWAGIYRLIGTHAPRTFAEAQKQVPKKIGDHCPYNHFLQKGAVLLYAGLLYPEFEDASRWVKMGRRVVSAYIHRHVYPDGGSVEACPSYSHFIARLCLDAHVLLEMNGKPGISGLRGHTARQYEFLAQTTSPDWLSLQAGDSYALDARRDLEIAGKIFPLKAPDRKRSVCFRASRFALLRSRNTAVYVDAMPGGGWHNHRGKPNVLAWHRGNPVLIDSGCVNYDKEKEREGYLKARGAHNVVVVEPVEKDEWPGDKTTHEIVDYRSGPEGGTVVVRCDYSGRLKYSWLRTVTLASDEMKIEDTLRAARPMKCVLHFHFAECRVLKNAGGFVARNSGWKLACACGDASGRALRATAVRRLAVDDSNERFKAPDVSFRQTGRLVVFRTVLRFGREEKS